MINVQRNPDGTITVPVRIEEPDGLIGDGMADIGPDHPDYKAWDAWLTRWEAQEG